MSVAYDRDAEVEVLPPLGRYYVGLLFFVLAGALVLLGLGWLINGFFTIRFFMGFGVPAAIAGVIHLFISAGEQSLWRARTILEWYDLEEDYWPILRWLIWPLRVVVGVIDVYSSTVGLMWFFAASGDRGWRLLWVEFGHAPWVALGELIAIAPEPLFVALAVVLVRLVRRIRGSE